MHTRKQILNIFLIIFVFFSPVVAFAQGIKAADLTVIVYMVADNDLEEEGMRDLEEMIAVKNPAVQFVVLADRSSENSDYSVKNLGNWDTAKRLLIRGGKTQVLANLGNRNTGDPKVLEEHIVYSVKNYPAAHYAMLFWDHGGGWSVFGVDETSGGDGFDITELKLGLSNGLKKAGLARFDLIGFDACLMGNIETAIALQSYADYFLASAELAPGHGWDYRYFDKVKTTKIDGLELGRLLIDGYSAQAKQEGTVDAITLSLISNAELPGLTKSWDALGLALKTVLEKPTTATFPAAFGRSASGTLRFGKGATPEDEPQLLDLLALCIACKNLDPRLEGAIKTLETSMVKTVVAKFNGRENRNSGGLSVYFPLRSGYYDSSYDGVGPASWRAVLNSYWRAGSSATQLGKTQGGFGFAADDVDVIADEDGGYIITAPVKSGTALGMVDATLDIAVFVEDIWMYLSTQRAELSEDGTNLSAYWYPGYIQLVQGKTESLVFADMEEFVDEDGNGYSSYSIPLAYFANGKVGDTYETVYLEGEVDYDGNVLSQTWYRESASGAFGEFKPKKGSKIVPLLEAFASVEDEETELFLADAEFDGTKSIKIEWIPLDSGENLLAEFSVWDASEEGEMLQTEFTLD